MEDLETLKIIKEKEQSINEEIAALKAEKEKLLQQIESSFSLKLKENEEKLRLQASKELEEARKKAQAHADSLLIGSREKAEKLRLRISDQDLERLATETFSKYIEGM